MRQKDLIELVVTVVLVIVMIFSFANAGKKLRSRTMQKIKPKVEDSVALPVDRTKIIEVKSTYNSLEQQVKTLELKRDPFTAAPIIIERNTLSGVSLTGILWDQDKPMAIIDGEVVKKGARIGKKTLLEIKRDRVILSDGEVLTEITLER